MRVFPLCLVQTSCDSGAFDLLALFTAEDARATFGAEGLAAGSATQTLCSVAVLPVTSDGGGVRAVRAGEGGQ
jgi:hypothetical protein